jgi:hypothetical protein
MKKLLLLSGITVAMITGVHADCLEEGQPPHSQAYADCVFYMKPTAVDMSAMSKEAMAKLGSNIAAYCSAAIGR